MMITWALAGITLLSGIFAAVTSNIRHSVLCIWVAGLSVGGLYLSLGAEYLAVLQWIMSTAVAIASIFFIVILYESRPENKEPENKEKGQAGGGEKRQLVPILSSVGVAAGFVGVVWTGMKDIPEKTLSEIPLPGPSRLAELGKILTEDHLISLEVLALTLLLVLVSGAVVARPGDSRQGGAK